MDEARRAAAAAAMDEVEPGMTIGLGSGRAVWGVIHQIRARWPDRPPLRAVVASTRTEDLAREAGFELVELDEGTRPAVAIDGADEIDPALGLLKGGGGALLREKIVIAAADRFVVVAEARKRVDRLGATRPLPVEVVRFGWRETSRRLLDLVADTHLRSDEGDPFVTDEGHYILDCTILPDTDPADLGTRLKALPGVVEHGLFIGMADLALLGHPDGTAERVPAAAN